MRNVSLYLATGGLIAADAMTPMMPTTMVMPPTLAIASPCGCSDGYNTMPGASSKKIIPRMIESTETPTVALLTFL